MDVIGQVAILHTLESLPKFGDTFLDQRGRLRCLACLGLPAVENDLPEQTEVPWARLQRPEQLEKAILQFRFPHVIPEQPSRQ